MEMPLLVVLKFVLMELGVQLWMMDGAVMMPKLLAGNLDLQLEVSHSMIMIDKYLLAYYCVVGAIALANNQLVYGSGSGPIWLDSVGCNGRELKLLDCNLNANTNGDYHWEDAGLICQIGGW